MTWWKWWRETRVRWLIALAVTGYFAWFAGEQAALFAPGGRCSDRTPSPAVLIQAIDARLTSTELRPQDRAALQQRRMEVMSPPWTCAAGTWPDLRYEERHEYYWADSWFDDFWTPGIGLMLFLVVMVSVGGPAVEGAGGFAGITLTLPRSRDRLLFTHAAYCALAALMLPVFALLVVFARTLPRAAAPEPMMALWLAAIAMPFLLAAVAAALFASAVTRHLFGATILAALLIGAGLVSYPLTLASLYWRGDSLFFSPSSGPSLLAAAIYTLGLSALAFRRFTAADF